MQSVLVAEDDAPIRSLVETFLQRSGFEVVSVGDGNWAISQIKAHDFDAMVIDLMMAPTSGYAVLNFLQGNRPESLRRVVVLTAVAGTMLRNVKKYNVSRVVQKPFDLSELLEAVRVAAQRTPAATE